MLDKAKLKFLKSIRQKIYDNVRLTGDDMEMFSYFQGPGTGTQLGVASSKTSIDLALNLKERVMLSACYSLTQRPQFRNCPDTGSRQIQYDTIVSVSLGDIFRQNQSADHGPSILMLVSILDVLIAQETTNAPKAD